MATKYIVTLHSTRAPMSEEHLKGWCREMSEHLNFEVDFDAVKGGCDKIPVKTDTTGITRLSVQVIQ